MRHPENNFPTGKKGIDSKVGIVTPACGNRTIYAHDCLDVLSDHGAFPNECVDLIYLDPPFSSQSKYNLPFKGKYGKDFKPVMAFSDTWTWGGVQDEQLERLRQGDLADRNISNLIALARAIGNERPNTKHSTSAYLINMAVRLKQMRRVLSRTGTIYLHCDPKASHYLKLMMDAIFGKENFRNEIIWHYYNETSNIRKAHCRKHDVILFYAKDADRASFNEDIAREPYEPNSNFVKNPQSYKSKYRPNPLGKRMHDVWTVWRMPTINNMAKERLGYPTQKPLSLLRRIVATSSKKGDTVLDPFCGCGTTVHAAEELGRHWIGIDISQFSASLIRNRLVQDTLNTLPLKLRTNDISILGTPTTLSAARQLAKKDKFEFEKWACGEVGAQGLYHNPGTPGSDAGVDGVIPFYHTSSYGQSPKQALAIVQVKGGRVSADNVKALSTTVRQHARSGVEAKCGVFVCFDRYMQTVRNNMEQDIVKDWVGDFPFIQPLSVEDLIKGKRPNLPGMLPQAGEARVVLNS